ncbi:hypothetical protein N0V94_008478, partial [Neodidymelliopsis sp. IMI 364377]
MTHIVVIGAGVIGLQTAVTLLESNYHVTILAKHWPGDETIEYCSPWAGAIWRAPADSQSETDKWETLSFETGMNIIRTEPEKAKEMGIAKYPLSILSNGVPAERVKEKETFAVAINPQLYLHHLLTRAKNLGAQTVTATLSTLPSFLHSIHNTVPPIAHRPASLIVNCTGLGAKPLCNDTTMYSIRGQTLLARLYPPPAQPKILIHRKIDKLTYIVPRVGTDSFILGGTMTEDAYEADPDAEISRGIMERCGKLVDNESEVRIEVLAEQVGLRPGRRGGPRVEIEEVGVDEGK